MTSNNSTHDTVNYGDTASIDVVDRSHSADTTVITLEPIHTVQTESMNTNSNDNVIAVPVAVSLTENPPSYTELADPQRTQVSQVPQNPRIFKLCEPGSETPNATLPNYETATDLPTYEEAERTKLLIEQDANTDNENLININEHIDYAKHLGTDGLFLICFLISLVFNWVGLLCTLCMSQTVAARTGAISGFGLSLISLLKFRTFDHKNFMEPWLCGILVFAGVLLFFRGFIQYLVAKRQYKLTGTFPIPGVTHRQYLFY